MNRVNPEVVRTKSAAIRQAAARISELAAQPDEQFWSDERNIATLKLWLIQMMQDAADLCNHLAARLLHRAPSSYPECFEMLGESGIISTALADSLRQMARFHNLLIHRYWEVDDQRVLEIAPTQLNDLEQFLQVVARATMGDEAVDRVDRV